MTEFSIIPSRWCRRSCWTMMDDHDGWWWWWWWWWWMMHDHDQIMMDDHDGWSWWMIMMVFSSGIQNHCCWGVPMWSKPSSPNATPIWWSSVSCEPSCKAVWTLARLEPVNGNRLDWDGWGIRGRKPFEIQIIAWINMVVQCRSD